MNFITPYDYRVMNDCWTIFLLHNYFIGHVQDRQSAGTGAEADTDGGKAGLSMISEGIRRN